MRVVKEGGRGVGMLKLRYGKGKDALTTVAAVCRPRQAASGWIPSNAGFSPLPTAGFLPTAVFCEKKNKPLDFVAWVSRFP